MDQTQIMSATPFNPEPVEALQARYPQAIETPYSSGSILGMLVEDKAPSKEHIFDFDDGIRMIVSSLRFNNGYLQFSFAGIEEPAKYWSRADIEKIGRERAFQFCGRLDPLASGNTPLSYYMIFLVS